MFFWWLPYFFFFFSLPAGLLAHADGQVETDETESGNGKAEIWKWSSQLFQELPFAHARTVRC